MARTQLDQYVEAEEDFKVADASPSPDDRFDAQLNRGRMRLRKGDYAGAEQELSKALSHDPKSFDAVLARGSAREALGHLSSAAEDYLEAVKLQPKNATANLRLGVALVEMQKTGLGRRYLERTVELDPTGEMGAKARLLLETNPPS